MTPLIGSTGPLLRAASLIPQVFLAWPREVGAWRRRGLTTPAVLRPTFAVPVVRDVLPVDAARVKAGTAPSFGPTAIPGLKLRTGPTPPGRLMSATKAGTAIPRLSPLTAQPLPSYVPGPRPAQRLPQAAPAPLLRAVPVAHLPP